MSQLLLPTRCSCLCPLPVRVWVGTVEQPLPPWLNSHFFSPDARGGFTRDEIKAQHLQMASFLCLWSLQTPLNWNKNTNVIPRGGRACGPWAHFEFSALLVGPQFYFFSFALTRRRFVGTWEHQALFVGQVMGRHSRLDSLMVNI